MACLNYRNSRQVALPSVVMFSVQQNDPVLPLKSRTGTELCDITNARSNGRHFDSAITKMNKTLNESSDLKRSVKCATRNPLAFKVKHDRRPKKPVPELCKIADEKENKSKKCKDEIPELGELVDGSWTRLKADDKQQQILKQYDGLCVPDIRDGDETSGKEFRNHREWSRGHTSSDENISTKLIQLRCKRLSLRQKDLCFKRQNISLKRKGAYLIHRQEQLQELAKQLLSSPVSPQEHEITFV